MKTKVRRIFARGPDSGEYAEVGWILDNEVDNCMICLKEFKSIFGGTRHHCRGCGNLICSTCSQADAQFVVEIKSAGPQRLLLSLSL